MGFVIFTYIPLTTRRSNYKRVLQTLHATEVTFVLKKEYFLVLYIEAKFVGVGNTDIFSWYLGGYDKICLIIISPQNV